ncbi:MAG: glycosyltransferase family 39 protein [Actinobacteria bacterium]|nr:glycosyltransferase family 39 protein [Actinomycetota bacterium]
MLLQAGVRSIIILFASIWAALIYYLFFQPFSYFPTTAAAIYLGLAIVALLGIYSLIWYLVKGRRGSPMASLSDLPGLLLVTFALVIVASCIIAITVGDLRDYLGNNIQEVAFLLAIITAAFYLGDIVVTKLKLDMAITERIFISTTTGLGIMALSIFSIGMVGAIYALPVRALVLILAILGASRVFRSLAPGLLEKLRFSSLPNPLALSIAIFLGLGFTAAWIPTWNYDSLLYHIAIPKFYMLAHKIYYIRDFLPSNYPLNGEMLFMLALLVKDDTLAQLLSYFISAWLVLGVFVFSRRFYSYRAAIISVALLLTISSFTYQIPINNNDTILALFTLTSIYALVAWWEKKNDRWLYLAGLMLGLAAGSKYSGFFLLATMGLLTILLIIITERKGPAALIRIGGIIAAFSIAAFIGVGPWLVKNYLFTGNPTYPMFISVFGGRDWVASSTDIFRNTVRNACLVSRGPLGHFSVPWYLTIREPSEMTIGPAFLAFLPLILKRDNLLKASVAIPMIAAIGFLVPWAMLLAQVARFALPGLVLLVVVIAASIDGFISRERPLITAVAMLLMIGVLTNIFLLAAGQYDALEIGVAHKSHRQFMETNVLHRASGYVNNHIPTDKRIAMIIDNRAYYFNKRDILMLNPLNNGRIDQLGIDSPDGLMHILIKEDIDYVFATDEVRRYTYSLPKNSPYEIYRPIVENLDRLIGQERLKPVFRTGDFWLYKVIK